MENLDLRPLSLGEILDRSFTIYRQHFALFVGIAVIPQLLVLALKLVQLFTGLSGRSSATVFGGGAVFAVLALGLLGIIVYFVAYLLAQGATVSAVSDLYLGRATTIGDSLRKARAELGTLFGVVSLSGLVTFVAFLLLIIPGIYMTCRLLIAVPAAMIEKLYARESLERSFALTKGSAGRAFLILLLYLVILLALLFLVAAPFGVGLVMARNNPAMMSFWTALIDIVQSATMAIVTPILLISTSVFYFDLRVRKEAFDLQMMLNPSSAPVTGGAESALS